MTRLILHAGMNKTGTTSIQASLSEAPLEGMTYFPFTAPNHSRLIRYLDDRPPEKQKLLTRQGQTAAALNRDKALWTRRLQEALAEHGTSWIISAEALSAQADACANLGRMITAAGRSPEVFLYVRPPHSMMESVFQQRLKLGRVKWDMHALWPNYRSRVEHLEQAFGAANVHLRVFDPKTLRNGDVVQDFADWIGLPFDPANSIRKNDALAAETAALLYLQRKVGTGTEPPSVASAKRNKAWIKVLSGIGQTKLRFATSLVDPVIAANRDDLTWIERRLGRSLTEERKPDGTEIGSEEELLRLALKSADRVRRHLISAIDRSDDKTKHNAVRLAEALRAIH